MLCWLFPMNKKHWDLLYPIAYKEQTYTFRKQQAIGFIFLHCSLEFVSQSPKVPPELSWSFMFEAYSPKWPTIYYAQSIIGGIFSDLFQGFDLVSMHNEHVQWAQGSFRCPKEIKIVEWTKFLLKYPRKIVVAKGRSNILFMIVFRMAGMYPRRLRWQPSQFRRV